MKPDHESAIVAKLLTCEGLREAKALSIAPEAPRFDIREALFDEDQCGSYRAVQSNE
jgi:hypothetical protein